MKRLIAASLLAALLGTAIPAYAGSEGRERRWKRKTINTLRSAAVSEESWRTSHDSYTTSVDDLKEEGFHKPRKVRVRIPWANEVAYCITAIHRKLEQLWHFWSDDGEAKRGRCPAEP